MSCVLQMLLGVVLEQLLAHRDQTVFKGHQQHFQY